MLNSRRVLRIAIVHENWGAGAARCAMDLRRELGRGGHEICYFPRSSGESGEVILAELAQFRPDVVHCHSFYGNLPYEFLPTVSGLYPTCFTVHDPRPIGTMDLACWSCEQNAKCRRCPLVRSGWRQLLRNPYYQQRKVKRQAHRRCPDNMQIVAPSDWMLRRLGRQELGRFGLRHIPYGIDLDHFGRLPNTRAEFGLPQDQPVVLFSAWYETNRTVGVRKGLADLAEAFISGVVPAMPRAILAVAGESFVPNHPNVRPLGLVGHDRLPQMFSAADVYVLPTLADNLPYTVLEAMGCALPVVATNVGGIPEQIAHGETGLLVSPAQPAALGAAILEVLSNPDRARQMGGNGRARAEAMYSMGAFVAAYERLFREMTGFVDA
jgi:glycosyltransferase involved in cell wall biosynthesis